MVASRHTRHGKTAQALGQATDSLRGGVPGRLPSRALVAEASPLLELCKQPGQVSRLCESGVASGRAWTPARAAARAACPNPQHRVSLSHERPGHLGAYRDLPGRRAARGLRAAARCRGLCKQEWWGGLLQGSWGSVSVRASAPSTAAENASVAARSGGRRLEARREERTAFEKNMRVNLQCGCLAAKPRISWSTCRPALTRALSPRSRCPSPGGPSPRRSGQRAAGGGRAGTSAQSSRPSRKRWTTTHVSPSAESVTCAARRARARGGGLLQRARGGAGACAQWLVRGKISEQARTSCRNESAEMSRTAPKRAALARACISAMRRCRYSCMKRASSCSSHSVRHTHTHTHTHTHSSPFNPFGRSGQVSALAGATTDSHRMHGAWTRGGHDQRNEEQERGL